jgi:uncharacterized membrane protein YgcG
MKHISNFQDYNEMNEGFKNWVSTFLVLAGLGLVPPSIALGQNKQQQKEFVENIDKEKLDGALFVDYLNKLGGSKLPLDTLFKNFKSENPNVKSDLNDVKEYITKNGKQYSFNQKYVVHDYSNVDITKFQPDNWLTDMASMIEDSQEPLINNWISDYEEKTTVEIGIITINKLPEDKVIEDYALEQFRRLGVGKKGANNGILIVLSKEDRKWNITTGYGIEGLLPDITCSEIGYEEIIPHFKNGDYYGGVMAALERIKAEVGYENVEDKKHWIEQQKQKEAQERAAMWDSFFEVSIQVLLIGLVLSLIGWSIYKRRKHLKKMKEMKENIDQIISEIEKLKTSLPTSEFTNSPSLMNLYNRCKNFDTSISKEYTEENEQIIKKVYFDMKSVYTNYKSKNEELKRYKSEINAIKKIESQAIDVVKSAIKAAEKIEEYGYQAKSIPSTSEVDKLSSLIPVIITLMSSNIDDAISEYKNYKSRIEDIKDKGARVISSLSGIESAISRVNNWKSEVDSLLHKFKSSGGNMSKLNTLLSEFESKLSRSKDWVSLSSDLDKIISYIKKVISDYEYEQRRKREEEEERKRRERRRREEEQERSRSYYSSSSSSSSSSSWGGFGGGSSGGGGASGSW